MGTHPIFESDFDCLTEMSMDSQNVDSNQNQAKLTWGDLVWVKWPRSPQWPGRIDCIKADLYKTKQNHKRTGEKILPIYFFGCKDVAFVRESLLTPAAEKIEDDDLALKKVPHVERKFAQHVADAWKEAMVEMFTNPKVDFQFDLTPAGEDQMVNWVHGKPYRYSSKFTDSKSGWDHFKKK